MGTEEKPTEIVEPDFFDIEERIEHPSHPSTFLCGTCKDIIKDLERAFFVLGFQPLFHFFTDEQLYEVESYFTGENRDTMKLPGKSATPAPATAAAFARRSAVVPWLKTEHLTTEPREATILDSQYDPDASYGEQVVVKLSFGPGRNFRWGLKVGKKQNPNYDILVDQFGDDSDNWKGKKIHLALSQDSFTEQEWPTVVGFGDLQSPPPKSKRA